MERDKQSNGYCPAKPKSPRNAEPGDMPELRRLFYNMTAEAGIDDFNISKPAATA
jgi:hypothetical protein